MTNAKPKTGKLVIFGSAEIAALARFYFENDSEYDVVGFTVDDEFAEGDTFEDLPLVPFSRVQQEYPASAFEMHVALSYRGLNSLRRKKYRQAKEAGYSLASYVCTKSATWPDLTHGDNCFILENQTIQPTCIIGNNVMIWSGNHIGHGTRINDHAYIASHAVISGHCEIGEMSFIGVNATVRDFTKIGASCFIGMDASVIQDVPEGAMVVADTPNIMLADDRRARMLKRKFFGPEIS